MKVLSDPDPLLGIIIKFKHPIMVDGNDDGSDNSEEGSIPGYSQESSDSLPPLCFRTIWDCPGITLDQIENSDGKVITGWRCGYCPIPGGLGSAPFFKYRNATKALSHLSSKGYDIVTCKGIKNIPTNVRNALTALQHAKINKKSHRNAQQNTIVEEIIGHQTHALSVNESCR